MRTHVRNANKLSGGGSGPQSRLRVGLIVNPVAGLGGTVGLKGTDGAAAQQALALGARPQSQARAARALEMLLALKDRIDLVCAPNAMGADLATSLGFSCRTLGTAGAATTSRDSRDAAAAMAEAGVGLIIFAGGDGTARDVFDGAPGIGLLGVPTGVKMHSGVFGASPEAAGRVAALVLSSELARVEWREAEIMDIDEEALSLGHVAARLYGYARSPLERTAMQNCKTPSRRDDDPALDALARRIVREMDPGVLHVLGCGTTMRKIKRQLGGDGTLLGVDVALNGRLIATDVDEARLLRLTSGVPFKVITGVTGGQGFVFGRGNQQISAAVLQRAGRDNVMIVTSQSKLVMLDPPCLRVDTGDRQVDAMLAGYMRVHTAPGHTMMMRIAA
ncbi:MAG: ATP-NAD kinase family protein [Hyphomicrobiales bacterium]|nr:ATP-NAD kinase family protein [Hyphomicrobiales bacterium]